MLAKKTKLSPKKLISASKGKNITLMFSGKKLHYKKRKYRRIGKSLHRYKVPCLQGTTKKNVNSFLHLRLLESKWAYWIRNDIS